MSLIPDAPAARTVHSADGLALATYEFSDDQDAPVVFAVHGFASSAIDNWHATGWTRELARAGYRVIALDQRGHGKSAKPHDPAAYTMPKLVSDVLTVLDTYLLDDVAFIGYSLGARVGWHASTDYTHLINRAVLGGIPDGDPLTRFRVDEALSYLEHGKPIDDRLTAAYLSMAAHSGNNDLRALVALVEGMRDSLQPDPANPPLQPLLFATGSEDSILEKSRRLAAATPQGAFFEIPDRNHFNAPTARAFRDRALAFLTETASI